MKYQELAECMKADIDKGCYQDTGRLPTEDSLMEQYGVTRYCVRGAINLLTEQGTVYPVQGSGSFIRQSKKEGCLSLHHTKGLAAEFPEEKVSAKVLKLETLEADEKTAKRLKCRLGTPVYFVVRLRMVEDRLFAVEYSYYNKEIIRYLNREIAEDSIYRYIREAMGLSVGFADKVIYCEKLAEDTAGLLELTSGDPAMVVEDDVYLSDGRLFDASRVIYNYQYARFFTLANRKQRG